MFQKRMMRCELALKGFDYCTISCSIVTRLELSTGENERSLIILILRHRPILLPPCGSNEYTDHALTESCVDRRLDSTGRGKLALKREERSVMSLWRE